jgi:hypothetical protein
MSALARSGDSPGDIKMFENGGTQPSALIVPPAGSDNDAENFPDAGLMIF